MIIWEFPQIERHQLTIIATDGAPVEPLVVDCFISHSGERYDFILNTLTDPNISEVFIRLRAVPVPGAADRLRDMARLIIVDDMSKFTRSNTDYLPVLDNKAYYTPYKNDSVSKHEMILSALSRTHASINKRTNYPENLQTLNHPDTICGTPGSYCVPDLVPLQNAQYESLRNIHKTEHVEEVPVDYGLLIGKTLPSHFLSNIEKKISK